MSAILFTGLAVSVGVVICASTTLCYCCCKRIIKNHEKKEERHRKLSERSTTRTDTPKRKKKKKTRTKDVVVDIERSASVNTENSNIDSNNEFHMEDIGYPRNGLYGSTSSGNLSNSKMNGNIEIVVESSREFSKPSQLSQSFSISQSPSTDDDSSKSTPASPPHIIILSQSQNPQVTHIHPLPSSPQKNPLAISHSPKLRTSQKMPIGKAKGVRSYEVLPGLNPQAAPAPPFNPLEENTMKNLQKEFQQKLKLSRKGSAFNIAKQNAQVQDSNDVEYVPAPKSPIRQTHIKDVKKSLSFPTKFPDEAASTSEESLESGHPPMAQDDSYIPVPSAPTSRLTSPIKQSAIVQIDSLTSYYNDSATVSRSTSEDSKTSEIEIPVSPLRASMNNNNNNTVNNNNNNRSKLRAPMFRDLNERDDESDGVEVVPKEEPKPTVPDVVMTLPNHTLDLYQQVTKQ